MLKSVGFNTYVNVFKCDPIDDNDPNEYFSLNNDQGGRCGWVDEENVHKYNFFP